MEVPDDLSLIHSEAILDFYGMWTQLSGVFAFLDWDLEGGSGGCR